MAEYIEYHPLKFWLDPASIAEIVAHIQSYLVANPINSTTEIETIIHDYLIAHPEIIGGVRSINGETGEVVLTADNISGGENVTIKDVLDSLQDQIDDIVASIPSDYQQLIDDVSDLKIAYDNLTYTEYNYFNPQDAIEGIRYDGSTGSAITAVESSAFAGIIFNVEYNKTYVVSRTDYFWIELDENNIILGFHSNANPHEFLAITPNKTGVKKVALSWRKSYVPIDNYMILDPNVSFNTYIKYPSETFIYKEVLNASGAETKEIYTVGSNGDFTSFTDMLVSLKDNSNPKVVYVNGGTYDIFAEMGGQEYIESISVDDAWSSVNHFVPPNTEIIGLGEVILTYLPTQTQMVSEDIAWKMSPLNIVHSCHIENITVKATNCRYAIHIERVDGESDKADITLKNVKAEWITGSSAHQAVGTGIGYNAHWLFEECIFKTDSTYPVFSVHTNAPDEHCGATIIMRNCVLISSHTNANTVKMVLFVSQYLPFSITNFVKIANCYTNGKIATDITNANTLKRQSFSVDVIGGSSYGIVDSQDQTSGYLINNYGSELLS